MSSKKTPVTSKQNINKESEEESLIEFPCKFPVKVMGLALPEFHTSMTNIATAHDVGFDSEETTQNISKTGKYVSLTLNIHVKDRPQLDAIYKDFVAHEWVLWAL